MAAEENLRIVVTDREIMKTSIISYLAAFAPTHNCNAFHREERQEVPKDDSNRKKLHMPSKQGQQVFTYPDGFSCSALNKKNADKKYNRWLDSKYR